MREADGSSSAILLQLLTVAGEALECDPGRARLALSRAVAFIEAEAAPQEPGGGVKGLAPWQARKVAAHITRSIEQTVRVEQLAAMARLSSSCFSRAFRTTFGRSPQQFILEQRIARAKQAMITTEDPLRDIALSCGFSDQAHLTRVFRRMTGDTPRVWRWTRHQQ